MGKKKRNIENTQNIVAGYRPTASLLNHSPKKIKEIWIISSQKISKRRREVLLKADQLKIPVKVKNKEEINQVAFGINHQGIVCLVKGFDYIDFEQMAKRSISRGANGLILIADHITDEGNLGAMLRAASFFGVDGIIIPKDRSASITRNVVRKSSGAWLHIPVCRVVNLGRTIDQLEDMGFWIIGTDERATTSVYEFNWKRPVVLIMGSEQKGMSSGLRKRCHEVINIPSIGYPNSLNVSVATGVILSEIIRQRGTISLKGVMS